MEYVVSNSFAGIGDFLKRNFFRILLFSVIGGTSLTLISETGGFFNMGAKGYVIAFLIEAMIISLSVYRPGNLMMWIVKYTIIAGLILIIIGGASNHAVKPVLERDNIASADKIKLAEINSNLDAAKLALESVPDGNPKNKLWRSQQLAALIEQKKEFLSTVKPDTKLESASHEEVWIIVGLRILMQVGNLILISWFMSMFDRDRIANTVLLSLLLLSTENKKRAESTASRVSTFPRKVIDYEVKRAESTALRVSNFQGKPEDSGVRAVGFSAHNQTSHVPGGSNIIMGFVTANPDNARVSRDDGVDRTDSVLTRFIHGMFPLKADGTTIGRRKIADNLGMTNAETDLCFSWLKARGLIKVKGTKTFPIASKAEMLRYAQRTGVSGTIQV
jgi:hypothetical protein